MPFRRRRTTSRRRRRRRRPRRSILQRRVMQGLPDAMNVVLTYAQTFTPGTGTTHLQQFRGNSLFDPDLSGIGHQPHYFDQWATLYRRYLVTASRFTLTGTNNQNAAMLLGVWPSADSGLSAIVTPSDLLERPYVQTRQMGGKNANDKARMSRSMSTKKMRGFGVLDDDLGATVSANPSRTWFWNVYAVNFEATDLDFDYSVVIKYHVHFYDRQVVGPS